MTKKTKIRDGSGNVFADLGLEGRVGGFDEVRVDVVRIRLQAQVLVDLPVDVALGADDARSADIRVEARRQADVGVIDDGLEVLPLHQVLGAVPDQAVVEPAGLPADLRAGGVRALSRAGRDGARRANDQRGDGRGKAMLRQWNNCIGKTTATGKNPYSTGGNTTCE